MNEPLPPPLPRYHSIDAWRGIAAFMVLIWHMYWDQSPLAEGLWLGVQMFFVISGYCIAVAVQNAHSKGIGFRAFMARRVRRIGVPYLGSLLVAVLVRFFLVWLDGDASSALREIKFRPVYWFSNLTMTQWTYLTGLWNANGHGLATPWYNPRLFLGVHWSLNYEEQFYLLAALFLVLMPFIRPRVAVGTLTFGILVINVLRPGKITGLFLDYWLQFVCGVLVVARLSARTERSKRLWDLSLLVGLSAALGMAVLRGEFPLLNSRVQLYSQLSVCLAFAGALIVLWRWDAQLMSTRAAKLVGRLGLFSYSLYLVHRPALELFGRLFKDFASVSPVAMDLLLIHLVLLSAYGFFLVFERPFLNAPLPEPAPLSHAA